MRVERFRIFFLLAAVVVVVSCDSGQRSARTATSETSAPSIEPTIEKISAPASEGPAKIQLGVLNMTAKSLPRPDYPARAKTAGTTGEVRVNITTDGEGNVIEASTTSGNALLRRAAETAALRAKFDPVVLSGQKVKVSGVLIYNF